MGRGASPWPRGMVGGGQRGPSGAEGRDAQVAGTSRPSSRVLRVGATGSHTRTLRTREPAGTRTCSQSRVAEEGGAEGADKKEEGFTVKWPVSQMKTGKPVPCFIMYGLQVTIDCPH